MVLYLRLISTEMMLILGGNYAMKNRVFQCVDCGNRWEEPSCTAGGKHGYELVCPSCSSMKKTKIGKDGVPQPCGHGAGHQHHGHGRGCCGGHGHG